MLVFPGLVLFRCNKCLERKSSFVSLQCLCPPLCILLTCSYMYFCSNIIEVILLQSMELVLSHFPATLSVSLCCQPFILASLGNFIFLIMAVLTRTTELLHLWQSASSTFVLFCFTFSTHFSVPSLASCKQGPVPSVLRNKGGT